MQFDLVDKLRKMDVRYRTAVISAFLWGIASHGMGLFNKFSVHDDVMNYSVGSTYISGRWMLGLLGEFEKWIFKSGHFSLPLFNGLLAITLIAVCAALIVRMLEIKNLFFCMFIGGLMSSFPVITSLFGYMFTLHFYMISLLFAVGGVYCFCIGGKWYHALAGIVLIGSSLGIYQAFFPVALTLTLMYLVALAARSDSVKALLGKCVFCGLCLIGSVGFYFILNKICLSVLHANLLAYMGISTMGKEAPSEYLRRFLYTYGDFFYPNVNSKYYMYWGRVSIIYKIVVLVSVVLSLLLLVRIYKKNRPTALICALLMALLPFCMNSVLFMVGERFAHSLMVYAQLFPFVYLVWVLENTDWKHALIEKGAAVAVSCVSILILLSYCRVDNMCYLKATFAQSEAISYLTTLITQIKETDGYTDKLPVVFLNENTDSSLQSGDLGKIQVRYFPYGSVEGYVTIGTWPQFMGQWCGYFPTIVDGADFAELEEVKSMPHYPDDGSIRVINDTVVVNF